jgi:Flp pilus assembly pilin Flp
MEMKRWREAMSRFLADQAGSQNAEYVVLAGVLGGGAAVAFTSLKQASDASVDRLVERLAERLEAEAIVE